jgi:hypothetical protein
LTDTWSRPAGARAFADRLTWIALLIFTGRCLVVAWLAPFPNAYDEQAHFSFARHVLESAEAWPRLADLRLVDPAAPERWTGQPNYLNHPPVFYALLAAAAAPFSRSASDLIRLWRLGNVALAALAVALILRLGREAGWCAPAQAAFAALIAFNPTLPVLGGIVSNDNFALLGGALTCLGSFRLLAGGRSGAVWLAAAAGVLIAGLAKLTALLLCGLLYGGVIAWLVAAEGLLVLRSRAAMAGLIVAAVAVVPYLLLIVEHGSPAPFTAGQAAFLERRLAEMPEWRAARLSFWPYLGHFLRSLLVYWPPLTPTTPAQVALLALPAACLGIGLLGGIGALRAAAGGADDPHARLVACGILAIGAVLAIHFGFTYARHQETGWLRGVYPRYYFPLLAILPAACAWLIERCRAPRRRVALAALLGAATVCYDLLYGGLGA